MFQLWMWIVIGFGGGIVVGSFFEWALHRYVMHRPILGWVYPFRAHALVHHRIFRADHTYHLQHSRDRKTIPMAWWNGPAIVAFGMLPFIAVAWPLNLWGIAAGVFLAFSTYYATYEYLHWCMHLPRRRSVERTGFFFRLNGHHLLHHRYMGKNFNVVLPLADFCLGTLLVRAKVRFAQAQGPSVPDVQPRGTVASRVRSLSPAQSSTRS